MKLKAILIFLASLTGVAGARGEIVSVAGEAVYNDDGSKSKNECMRLAAEQARINALANRFGTVISQDILQSDRVNGNREENTFLALSSTEVKGEWVADEGEPQYTFSYDAGQNLIVGCKIKGKAQEITNAAAVFDALVLRNGIDKKNADNLFRDGDDMYLYFRSPSDGYLAVFLQDEKDNVYLLLPYRSDSRTRQPVKRDKDYVFFCRDCGDDDGVAKEEMTLTADFRPEYNRLYVVFSPESFSRPTMDTDGFLPYMKTEDFNKWLVKTRRNDARMGVRAMNLRISPK